MIDKNKPEQTCQWATIYTLVTALDKELAKITQGNDKFLLSIMTLRQALKVFKVFL